MRGIHAQRRLEFQSDIASLFAEKHDGMRQRAELAMAAFADDPETLSEILEKISRT